MFPSVRLLCYPDGGGKFGAHTALTLRIDWPDQYLPEDVIREIDRRLRETHPRAPHRGRLGRW